LIPAGNGENIKNSFDKMGDTVMKTKTLWPAAGRAVLKVLAAGLRPAKRLIDNTRKEHWKRRTVETLFGSVGTYYYDRARRK
jgi:hypothetical protein